jgi:hypothetical protein
MRAADRSTRAICGPPLRARRTRLPGAGAALGVCRLIAVAAVLFTGCTHLKLERNTLNQAGTLPDLQYQQVLDNLARFACDPNAIASHIKVTGGLVQVSDQGSGGAMPSQVVTPLVAPMLVGTRNVLGQWNVDAVVEPDDLELLQLAYQKATNPGDPNRQIKKDVFEKVCELCATFQIILAPGVADEMIEALTLGTSGAELAKLMDTRARIVPLYQRVDALTTIDPRAPAAINSQRAVDLRATKQEIVRLLGSLCAEPFIAGGPLENPPRGPITIEQAEDKVASLVRLVTDRSDEPNPFSIPWVNHACKKRDVPKCACYVGHYCGCGCECYIWVAPEQAHILRDFTLIVLSLAPPDAQEMTLPRMGMGAAFSPGL